PSLRDVVDLVRQMPGVVIATQLAQRRLVQLMQDLAELGRVRIAGGKALAVDLAQRSDQRIAMLLADRATLVPMATIKARFLHVSLPAVRLVRGDSLLPMELIGNGMARAGAQGGGEPSRR